MSKSRVNRNSQAEAAGRIAEAVDRLAGAVDHLATAIETRGASVQAGGHSSPPRKASASQLEKIRKLCESKGISADTLAAVLRGYRCKQVADLQMQEASEVIDRLLGKREPHIKEGGAS